MEVWCGKKRHGFLLLIHPARLTWNLQVTHLERKMIFQTSMIMFHVDLSGVYKWCSNTYKNLTMSYPWFIWFNMECSPQKCVVSSIIFVTSRTTKTIPKPETKSQSMWSFKTNAFGTLYLKSPWDPPEKNGRVR